MTSTSRRGGLSARPIETGKVHLMNLKESFTMAGEQFAPARELLGFEKAKLFKKTREFSRSHMAAVQEVLEELGKHDEVNRRNPVLLKADKEGNIHAVVTIMIAIGHNDKIKGAYASRRCADYTVHNRSGAFYMGSPRRPAVKDALYKQTKLLMMIDACVALNTAIARIEALAIDRLIAGLGPGTCCTRRATPARRRSGTTSGSSTYAHTHHHAPSCSSPSLPPSLPPKGRGSARRDAAAHGLASRQHDTPPTVSAQTQHTNGRRHPPVDADRRPAMVRRTPPAASPRPCCLWRHRTLA